MSDDGELRSYHCKRKSKELEYLSNIDEHQHMHFRRAVIEDLPAIVVIYNSAIEAGGFTADLDIFTIEERRPWFEKANADPYGIWVLLRESEVLGYFYFSSWRSGRRALRKTAEVSFYLAEEERGKGLGFLMLKESFKKAKKQKIEHLLAILLKDNHASSKLLEKCGFHVVGTLKDVAELNGQSVSQIIMAKALSAV